MDPAEDGLPIPQRYWAILTLMVGVGLSCLDTALVNVALPRIAKDLNSSPADSIWVVNAYQLAVMISLLPLASFGDNFWLSPGLPLRPRALYQRSIDQRASRLAGDVDPGPRAAGPRRRRDNERQHRADPLYLPA